MKKLHFRFHLLYKVFEAKLEHAFFQVLTFSLRSVSHINFAYMEKKKEKRCMHMWLIDYHPWKKNGIKSILIMYYAD